MATTPDPVSELSDEVKASWHCAGRIAESEYFNRLACARAEALHKPNEVAVRRLTAAITY
jgi:hypothetical protein